jgi:hypothetical protein
VTPHSNYGHRYPFLVKKIKGKNLWECTFAKEPAVSGIAYREFVAPHYSAPIGMGGRKREFPLIRFLSILQ